MSIKEMAISMCAKTFDALLHLLQKKLPTNQKSIVKQRHQKGASHNAC